MDILNFISWIKGGRKVTTVDPTQTLLPVGLKDPKRDDGYLTGAITVSDFGSQIKPFSSLVSPSFIDVNITSASEGTAIPDGATTSYTKTIPLTGLSSSLTTALVVFSRYEDALVDQYWSPAPGYTYGVTSPGVSDALLGMNNNVYVCSPTRLLVTTSYTLARRAQSFNNQQNFSGYNEKNEVGTSLTTGECPTYSEIGSTIIGVYSGNNRGVGYSSASGNTVQDHTVIKSAYIDNSSSTPKLVLLLKKRSATVSLTWTSLALRVYNVTA